MRGQSPALPHPTHSQGLMVWAGDLFKQRLEPYKMKINNNFFKQI